MKYTIPTHIFTYHVTVTLPDGTTRTLTQTKTIVSYVTPSLDDLITEWNRLAKLNHDAYPDNPLWHYSR
jgi:hypothetical protein